ncbi:Putative dihydrokaempferol 4-reductase (NAD-dependent epimerase/dehydratase) [Bradyrhizobium sp. ORS 278]|uniref:SDR family oxidoreductase n=1 Tax=Bradyrhizobium sp. (strain ORS 278) TaxID=114615 RepID=UPI0001508174|nr:aldehyde reductase [Bradyrhizobium sp. ORS 278]CAL78739.1 Putative dihydrokaempferol 4-reductase (NAD-dependent epimerase/dehydratase) [Bradyrhizobium sp. ORS 278]
MSEVLVTGGSGFIATHVILQLLAAGHRVRTTLRTPDRQSEVLAALARGGATDPHLLSFHAADLTRDDGWAAAVSGCDYVLHIASPLPDHVPDDENELIVPARDGTLRVLRAARDAGVTRVVLTSSFSAVAYGHRPRAKPFDEADWTDLDGPDVQPYPKSKTLAERAAWAFLASEGGALELATICPVAVLGPVLGPDFSPSIALVQAMLQGRAPAAPRIHLGLVDVRDVADLHLRAMTDPAARNERFLAVAGSPLSILEIATVLRTRLGNAGRRAPRRELPNWLARIVALAVPQLRDVKPLLGLRRTASSDKARRLLGWNPRPNDEIIAATAESLLRLGLVRP